jgi:hypothetical protein
LLLLVLVIDSTRMLVASAPTSAANAREGGTLRIATSRTKRALDSLEGDDFTLRKRALDLMEGDGFGFEKRALDNLEGDDFVGLKKRRRRSLDSLDGDDFSGFQRRRRALDALEGDGFGLRKRALDALEGDDFFGMQKRSGGARRLVALFDDHDESDTQGRHLMGRSLDLLHSSANSALLTPSKSEADEARLRKAVANLSRHRAYALNERLQRKRALDALDGAAFGFE